MEKVAIPIWEDRVSPVLDSASKLQVSVIRSGNIESNKLVEIGNLREHELARLLNELGVNLLICGAISEGLKGLCTRYGIRVIHSQTGDIETTLDRCISLYSGSGISELRSGDHKNRQ